eukprot:366037-Chlamydomonas_euryale.AAC.2
MHAPNTMHMPLPPLPNRRTTTTTTTTTPRPSRTGSTNAVSARLFSAATACRAASSSAQPAGSRQTAAGFPLKGRAGGPREPLLRPLRRPAWRRFDAGLRLGAAPARGGEDARRPRGVKRVGGRTGIRPPVQTGFTY